MKNNKKTLLLVTPYFPPHPGGLEKYAEAIALRLVKNFGWRVVVVTSSDEGRDSQELQNGLIVYRLKSMVKISNTPFSPAWIWKIRRIIRKEKPDVINAHAPVPGMADVAALVAGKVPFVSTYHSGTMKKGFVVIDVALGWYESLMLPRVFAKASRLISSSEFLRTGFLKKYQDKITTISPGVDVRFFVPGKSPTKQHILFVGDHSKAARYKGLDYLLDAVAILKKKVPEVTLTVVGPSDDLDFYRAKCDQLEITASVKFLGRMGEERVKEFQKARVFALPTSNDNFPMVIAEALSCGVPVVSTPIGNIPLMVEDSKTGFLVPTKNSEALADALLKILTDKKLHDEFGHTGREKATAELSWNSRVAATDALFNKLLEENGSSTIYQVSAYFPPHIGGVEQVVKSLSEKLISNNRKVVVLTTDSIEGRKFEKQQHVRFLKSFEFAHTPFAPTLLGHLLRIKKQDVVHLHVAQAYFPELTWLASKIKGFSYVAHFHLDVQASSKLGFVFNFYKRALLGPVLRSAKRVVVFSNLQRDLVVNTYKVDQRKIVVIPNGIGEDFFLPRTKVNLSKRVPRVLYVGRLVSAQKRVERLIEAVPYLKNRAEIDLVGDGEDRRELERLAKNLKLTNVRFHGAKGKQDLINFYKNADVFVLPSDQEGMPLVLLEAMAAGLPIIGSNVIGIKELIKDSGLLVEPAPRHFASAIDRLISDPELAKALSNKSFSKAREYSWDNLVSKFEYLYRRD